MLQYTILYFRFKPGSLLPSIYSIVSSSRKQTRLSLLLLLIHQDSHFSTSLLHFLYTPTLLVYPLYSLLLIYQCTLCILYSYSARPPSVFSTPTLLVYPILYSYSTSLPSVFFTPTLLVYPLYSLLLLCQTTLCILYSYFASLPTVFSTPTLLDYPLYSLLLLYQSTLCILYSYSTSLPSVFSTPTLLVYPLYILYSYSTSQPSVFSTPTLLVYPLYSLLLLSQSTLFSTPTLLVYSILYSYFTSLLLPSRAVYPGTNMELELR